MHPFIHAIRIFQRPSILIAGVVMSCFMNHDLCACSKEMRMKHYMRSLQRTLITYRNDHGHFPNNDKNSNRYEKLDSANYIRLEHFRTIQKNGHTVLVDMYDQPYILEFVPDSSIQHGQRIPTVRSIGRNGIDENGKGDDLDLRYGANWGYWHKRNWPEATVFNVAGNLITFILAMLCTRPITRFVRRLLMSGTIIAFGLVAIITGFTADSMFGTSASGLPDWVSMYSQSGVLIVLIGVIAGATVVFSQFIHKPASGYCAECGYNLFGIDSPQCPECGESITVTAAQE